MVTDEPKVLENSFYTKNGEMILEISQHKSGLWYRKQIADLMSIRESFHNYKNVLVSNRVVMDLGANIGAFTHLALLNGAEKVYSYEPEPYTYSMLSKNVGNDTRSHIFNRAVTNSTEMEIDFYVGYGNGAPSLASTIKRVGRRVIKVRNENFNDIVNQINPNTIKIDIEGGEYDLIPYIPDSCDEITIEWHGDTKGRKKQFETIYPLFIEQGWKIISEKKRQSYVKDSISKGIEPKWCIDGHYRR